MSGVKGRSGGKRAGAGRKPAQKAPEPPTVVIETENGADMLKLLQDVALGRIQVAPIQVRAAIAAVQYTHTKRHDGGKKDEAAANAKKAATGRFGVRSGPPALKVVGG